MSKKCGRCNKSQDDVFALAPIGNDFICNECAYLINKKMVQAKVKNKSSSETVKDTENNIPSITEITNYLDRYVIGQRTPKEVLSVALRNHLKRTNMSDDIKKDIDKSNIMLCGKTGTGKTAMITRLAEAAHLPYHVVDSNSITASGYQGNDAKVIISELYEKCGRDKFKTEHAIVVIDEIDKKRKAENQGQKDLGGEEVQKELLKIIEGTQLQINNNTIIDTSNILFIAVGAYSGIDKIIDKRLGKRSVGFSKTSSTITTESIVHDDLISYGMIPEFVGRFPVITATDDLTKDDLMAIITKTDNNIYSQYKALFKEDGLELVVDKNVFNNIIDDCMKNDIGVRGIRSKFESILHKPQVQVDRYKEKGIKTITIYNKDGDIKVKESKKENKNG